MSSLVLKRMLFSAVKISKVSSIFWAASQLVASRNRLSLYPTTPTKTPATFPISHSKENIGSMLQTDHKAALFTEACLDPFAIPKVSLVVVLPPRKLLHVAIDQDYGGGT